MLFRRFLESKLSNSNIPDTSSSLLFSIFGNEVVVLVVSILGVVVLLVVVILGVEVTIVVVVVNFLLSLE